MTSPTALILCASTVINYCSKTTAPTHIRIDQYVDGLTTLFQYIDRFNGVDIYFIDNTVRSSESINERILATLPQRVIVINDDMNRYGPRNKGAGLIEQWTYVRKIIGQYRWIIHFEPRMKIKKFDVFEMMLERPRNIFHVDPVDKIQVHTGFFMIASETLLDFIEVCTAETLCASGLSIEAVLYDYFKRNQLEYELVNDLYLVRYDYSNGQTHAYDY